jgi:preprotein translocase subunit SecE
MYLYKQGQGYWTRLMSAIAGGMVVVMGVLWLAGMLRGVRIGEIQPLYVSLVIGLVVCAIFGFIIYYYVGRKPRSVDFLIATEGEMKKVNWSSKREVFGSTWVVIGLCVFVTVFVFAFDFAFAALFRFLRVLDVA